MSWYYAQSDKQVGPVTQAEFDALVQSGGITATTLVWREGMANWQPYQQVRPGALEAVPAAPAPMASSGASGAINDVMCAECRQSFSRDNAINYGTVWVCASCKPLFVQKLKEGAVTAQTAGAMLQYAGFWIRFAAKFIDGLIGGIVVGIPTMLVMIWVGGGLVRNAPPGAGQILVQVLLQLFSLVFTVGYNTFFVGKYGATPGKMAVGVKVVAPDGAPIPFMRAFGRAWADYLSGFTCMIGYLIAAFDNEKRALHDHICSTRVVYK
jgi:uncharacterized RDD family membrane protein YckC